MYFRLDRPPRRRASPNPPSRSLVFRQVLLSRKRIRRATRSILPTLPRVSENLENSAEETAIERLATGSGEWGNHPLFGKIRDPARWPQESSREKDRRITDLESDRAQLREDRHRLTENCRTSASGSKIARGSDRHSEASDRRAEKLVRKSNAPFGSGFSPQTSCGGIGFHLPRRGGGILLLALSALGSKACRPGGLRCLRPTRSTLRNR